MPLGGSLAGVAKVVLQADTSQFNRELDQAHSKFRRSAGEFEKDAGRISRGALAGSGALQGLGRSIAFASGAFLGAAGLTATVRAGFDELAQGAKVAAQTNAVIKSTGEIAGVTAKHVDDLGASLLRKSGIDDEVIKSGENLLLTFTNVRNVAGEGNDVFDQATRASLDLSVALGKDLNSSVLLVGKALQDPIRGMTALRRAGVALTEQQKDQVKALVESGRVMDAQKIILAELTKEFGGSAAAAGKTLPGQINILRETFKNLEADLLRGAIPAIQGLVKWLQSLVDRFQKNKQAQDDVRQAFRDTSQAARTLFGVMKDVSDAVGGLKNSLELLLALGVASKVYGMARAFSVLAGSETAAGAGMGLAGAAGKAALLLRSLRALSLIGAITIGIELVIDKKKAGGIGDFFNSVSDSVLNAIGLGQYASSKIGSKVGTVPLGPSLADSSTLVRGVTGAVTPGIAAIEKVTGAKVFDDYASGGHAPNSYHYKGQAADLAPDPAVWAQLYSHKQAFAELFGPWGLYHFGVQFYDATLQKQHMDHIHVAYTGGPTAITKMLTGSSAPGAVAPTSGLSPKKPAATSELIPAQLRLAVSQAALTKTNADDLKALKDVEAYLEKRIASEKNIETKIRLLDQLASTRQQIATLTKKTGKIPGAVSGVLNADFVLARQTIIPGLAGALGAFQQAASGTIRETVNVPGIGKILYPLQPTIDSWDKVIDNLKKKLIAATRRQTRLRASLSAARRAKLPNKVHIANVQRALNKMNAIAAELRGDLGDAMYQRDQLAQEANAKQQADAEEAESTATAAANATAAAEDEARALTERDAQASREQAQQDAQTAAAAYQESLYTFPAELRLDAAKAAGTATTADDLDVLRREESYLQENLGKTSDIETQIQIINGLNGIRSEIQNLVGGQQTLIGGQQTQIDIEKQRDNFLQGIRSLRGFETNILGDTLGGSRIQVTNYFPTSPDDPHTFSAGIAFELQALVG